jgi:HEAT repeat protein
MSSCSHCRKTFSLLLPVLAFFLLSARLTGADVPALIEQLSSEEPREQTAARDALRQAVFAAGAPEADPGEAAQMEEQLLPYLSAETGKWARIWVIRQLVFIGGEPTVQALGGLALTDPDPQIRNEARETLAAIPLESATAALVQALQSAAAPEDALGALTSLAYRGQQAQAAVPAVSPWLRHENEQVAVEAAVALGKIGGETARDALLAAYSDAPPAVQQAIQQNVVPAGLTEQSAAGLVTNGANAAIRAGAFISLSRRNPQAAATLLKEQILADPEFPGRSAIVREAFLFDGPVVGKAVVEPLAQLPLPDQAAILGAIADVRMHQYEDLVLNLAKTEDNEQLRELALQALIPIASTFSYDYLHQLYTEGQHTNIVKEALARIDDPQIDARLIARAAEGAPAQRMAAIQLLGVRNPPEATPLLNDLISPQTPPEVLETVLEQIINIGNLQSAQRLISLILATQGEPIQREAQLALKRLADNLDAFEVMWAEQFQPAIAQAQTDEQAVSLILILDAVKTRATLDFLGETALGENEARRKAATQTLRRWHHIEVGDIWLNILNSPDATEAEKKPAAENILRLLKSKDVSGSMRQRIDFALKAFEQAADPELKRRILKALEETSNRREKRELSEKFEQYLDHPEVGTEVQALITVLGQ